LERLTVAISPYCFWGVILLLPSAEFGLRNEGTGESFYGDHGASSGCFVAWWEVKRRTVMVVE
jgi:hypothetical protein